jgi:hypothetical protein
VGGGELGCVPEASGGEVFFGSVEEVSEEEAVGGGGEELVVLCGEGVVEVPAGVGGDERGEFGGGGFSEDVLDFDDGSGEAGRGFGEGGSGAAEFLEFALLEEDAEASRAGVGFGFRVPVRGFDLEADGEGAVESVW